MPIRPTSIPTRALSASLLASVAAWVLTACGGGGADAGGPITAPPGGTAGLAGSWRQGGCGFTTGSSSAAQVLVITPRPTDRERADLALEWLTFASSNCTGSFQRLPAGAFGSVTVRRTQSSGPTTSTWAAWTTREGAARSAVWHWRGNALCLSSGQAGQADDPERTLPTARDVADYFARVPENSPGCYTRQ